MSVSLIAAAGIMLQRAEYALVISNELSYYL